MSSPDKSTNNAIHAEGFMARMWAGWRLPYINGNDDAAGAGCARGSVGVRRIFRSDLPDESTYILWRGETCFALMNAFPYTTGHLM